MTPFPDRKYGIIYADPPWAYRDKANAGNRGAGHKYPTQSAAWIRSLPVQNLSAEDCALFLWATMPQLPLALEVMAAWGFAFKTVAFTWVKRNRIASSWFWGMGNWTRANAELVLLGTKGKPKRIDAGVHSVLETPIRRHSQKPDETRDRIVRLLGDLPRIELFARGRYPGWDVWGLDVPEEEDVPCKTSCNPPQFVADCR
jgi:N6-adenosine-specific RNA methylase IME4